jgi:hypothetical protein
MQRTGVGSSVFVRTTEMVVSKAEYNELCAIKDQHMNCTADDSAKEEVNPKQQLLFPSSEGKN